MPCRARLDTPGSLHHVMVRGINRCRIVKDVQDRKNFVKRMGELSADMKNTIAEVDKQQGFDLRDIKNIKASESIGQLGQQRPLFDTCF